MFKVEVPIPELARIGITRLSNLSTNPGAQQPLLVACLGLARVRNSRMLLAGIQANSDWTP
jgi:hypothetical protein